MVETRLIYRSITIGSRRTSMRLEAEMWNAIGEICSREMIAIGELVRRAHQSNNAGGRTSAVRNFVLAYFRAAAHESTHAGTNSWHPSQHWQVAAPSSSAQ